MDVVLWPDPRLSRAAAAAPVDDVLRGVGERLLAVVIAAPAYGLAAAHIGEVAPVVVITMDEAGRDRRILFNPKIVATAEEAAPATEGSVSLPDIRVEITRPVWCEVAYEDAEGQPHTLRLEGFAARVAQHEIDQMNGVFFLDRVSRLKREMALKKWKKRAG
jgi:peptide deformylase